MGPANIYKFVARAQKEGKTEEHIFQRVAFSPQMAVFLVSRAVANRWPGWRVIIAPFQEGQ